IKLFGPDGFKLSDQDESEIEDLMEADLTGRLATPEKIGRASRLNDAAGRYIEGAKSTFPRKLRLDGMKIVIDCANGSAYRVAPTALWELGAEVIRIGCTPDGVNINEQCGSTHPEALCAAVVAHGAHLGIALDGDADRVLIADETGHLIDGDQILALIAQSWAREGRLAGNAIVATVMSNMGLERFLDGLKVGLERTAVGDRYVVECMRAKNINIGGEQSGHMVLTDFGTTGDGLTAALQILAVLVEDGRPASQVCRLFTPFPQKLQNVRFSGRDPLTADSVISKRAEVEKTLQGRGRLVLRKSGTEPLVRVMVEAEDAALVQETVADMCKVIQAVSEQG
ncbi:MAG: phosphoglucosamine mutase, partial [Acetobacter cibinongensis]